MVETECELQWLVELHLCKLCLCLCSQQIDQVCSSCPGSWRGSTQDDCAKLEQIHALHGARVVVDSVFGLQSKDFLIKLNQEDPTCWGTTKSKAATAVLLSQQATSLRRRTVSNAERQLSTWRIWGTESCLVSGGSTPQPSSRKGWNQPDPEHTHEECNRRLLLAHCVS